MLLSSLNGCDVSILVNNVGFIVSGNVDRLDAASVTRCVNINLNAVTYMSMILLPRLLQRTHRSAVVNLTSKLGFLRMGDFGVYGGCKNYLTVLTQAMQDCYAADLDVMLVVPGSVKSLCNPGTMPNSVPTEAHSRTVLNHLGWHAQTRGSWQHAASWWIQNDAPVSFLVGPVCRRRFINACRAVSDAPTYK